MWVLFFSSNSHCKISTANSFTCFVDPVDGTVVVSCVALGSLVDANQHQTFEAFGMNKILFNGMKRQPKHLKKLYRHTDVQ